MSLKPLIALFGLTALVLSGASQFAAAQTTTVQPTAPASRVAHHRIEIYPRPLLYRRCTDWYELQHRPSGTVLYPQMRCWWVRG